MVGLRRMLGACRDLPIASKASYQALSKLFGAAEDDRITIPPISVLLELFDEEPRCQGSVVIWAVLSNHAKSLLCQSSKC